MSSGVSTAFVCGNGFIDPGEECDGADLDGATCESLGQGTGTLECSSICRFNLSSCIECGNGIVEGAEQCDDGNTSDGDGCSSTCTLEGLPPGCVPGEKGCSCVETPTSRGVAGYYQEGRYCDTPELICRRLADNDWRCMDCTDPSDSGEGCPCPVDETCRAGLACVGLVLETPDPHVYPLGATPGVCWPPFDTVSGFCVENCEAQARACGTTFLPEGSSHTQEDVQCYTPDCFGYPPPAEVCELTQGKTCDRDGGSCVASCDADYDEVGANACLIPGEVCTVWGECYPT